MKLRLPNYYKNFKCIADKCKDSCCSAGWEIDIDDKTAEFYKNVKGNFGDKLRKNIKFGYETMKSDECSPNNSNTSHFIFSISVLSHSNSLAVYTFSVISEILCPTIYLIAYSSTLASLHLVTKCFLPS